MVDEQAFAYDLLNQLAGVTTPEAALEVISQYPRTLGATGGFLLWLEDEPETAPTWQEIAARWVSANVVRSNTRVGERYPLDNFWSASGEWFDAPNQPTFVEDMHVAAGLEACTRDEYLATGVQAMVFMPFKSGGNWIAAAAFRFAEPRAFSDEERAIFSIIRRNAASVIYSVRLLAENRTRARRAELVNEINAALSQAVDEQQVLDALMAYAGREKAQAILLFEIETDGEGKPLYTCIRAVLGSAPAREVLGQRLELNDAFRALLDAAVTSEDIGDVPAFFEDYSQDPRLEPSAQQVSSSWGFRTGVLLPLRNAGRWQGLVGINWPEMRSFTDEERDIYQRILPTLASIVASRISYLSTQDANEESMLMYRLAQEINAAVTYQEITDAVASVYRDCNAFQIQLWNQLDYETSDYIEVVAATVNDPAMPRMLGSRYPKETMPIMHRIGVEDMWVVEDVQSDARISEEMRVGFQAIHIHAILVGMFMRGSRWMGGMAYYYDRPRQFSARDRRLLVGFSEMVQAAVERIHSQMQTAAAGQRSEEDRAEAAFLYELAGAVNAATSYSQVLDAVVRLMRDADGVVLATWNNFDSRTSQYLEAVAATAVPGHPLASAHQTHYTTAAFPILDRFRPENGEGPLWAIGDVLHDPRVDEISRESWQSIQTRAYFGIMLQRGDAWLGGLSFHYGQPREFTPREYRLNEGIANVVLQAVERIRLQVETDAARKRAEEDREEAAFLYSLAETVNAATTYQELADAVVGVYTDCEGVYINIWENFDYERASYVECVAVARYNCDVPPINPGRVPREFIPLVEDVKNERLVIFEDTMNDPRADERTRATWRALGTYAMIAVALHQGRRYIGFVLFNYSEARLFSERESRRAQGIGNLVLGAIDRMRLQIETDSARRHAERLADVTAALASAADGNQILEAISRVPELHSGAFTVLQFPVYDGEGHLLGFQLHATRHPDGTYVDPEGDPFFRILFRVDEWHNLRAIAAAPEEVLYVENLATETRAPLADPESLTLKNGWLGIIMVPLWNAGHWQGNLQFLWREPKAFSDELRSLLDALRPVLISVVSARRSFLAAEQARQETEQRVNELTTVAQVSAAAVSLLDESRLLSEFVRLTRERFAPNEVTIYVLDERGNLRRTALESPLQDEVIALQSDALIARAGRHRTGLIETHFIDEELVPLAHEGLVPGQRASSELAVPMAVRERVLGVLSVKAPVGVHLGEAHLRVMSTLADLIAVAIQNVRSYRQAQELAALEERTRLARELHDSVSQALYGIGLGAQTARAMLDKDPSLVRQPLEYVLSLAQAGLTEMRALIFELRPESLENEGLITALAKQGASLEARHGIIAQLELGDEPAIPLDEKESLYRVAREALHNVIKHAQASKVTLRLLSTPAELQLDVIDNGRGFDTGRDFPGHLGLQSMRERVMSLGGRLEIASMPGAGSRVSVRLPIDSRVDDGLRQKPDA